MSLHETMVVCRLDGAQLEGHALLLLSHGEQRDRGGRITLRMSGSEVGAGRGSWYSVEGTVTPSEPFSTQNQSLYFIPTTIDNYPTSSFTKKPCSWQ